MTGQRTGVAVAAVGVIVGIVLIAATMRGPFTSVGPLLETIRAGTGLSATGAGVLNMVPLLGFVVVSPLAAGFAGRVGLERAIGVALAVLAIGVVLRSLPGPPALFGGTVLIGSGIGLINVLLSGLVRRDHPDRAAALTGLYTTTMGVFAMIGLAVAVPVAEAVPGTWRTSLGLWVILVLVALVAWLPRMRAPGRAPLRVEPAARAPWRSGLAWRLTAFMGLQSMGFYVSITWLPTILHSHGASPTVAGLYVALMQLTGLLASAVSPLIMRRLPDQAGYAAGAAALGVLSFLGFAFVPALSPLWSATVGLSQGAALTLALSFFALRARDAQQAAALSGMGQSIGYLLAALGPLLFGLLHDVTANWTAPLLVLAALITFQAAVGRNVGRLRQVEA